MTSHESLHFDVRLGILQTIANAIYGPAEGKIREAVANSVDNDASLFIIYLDRTLDRLSLFDNGVGIERKRFDEIFEHIGFGAQKYKPEAMSYFGLGLMSVFRLGEKAHIYTRSKNDDKLSEDSLWHLTVDVNKVFDKANEDKQIKDLINFFDISICSTTDRDAISPLGSEVVEKYCGILPESFTEIVIEKVDDDFIELIDDRPDDLRKYLPLKPAAEDPFLKSIKDEDASKWISDCLNNEEYCPTIDVYFGDAGSGDIIQWHKYFPKFSFDRIEDSTFRYAFNEEHDFAYYFLISNEDLHEGEKEGVETGFWVRNRNFLIKPADSLMGPGGKRLVHQPLSNWLYCEIFHKDMKSFLSASRSDYVWDDPNFKLFRDAINKIVQPINQQMREAWAKIKPVEESIIKPFLNITNAKGPLPKAEKAIENIIGKKVDGKESEEIFKYFESIRDTDIENERFNIEALFKKGGKEIVLMNDENTYVSIDSNVSLARKYSKRRDPKSGQIIFRISPTIFASKKTNFLGKSFTVTYIAGTPDNSAFSINKEAATIYINPFNSDVRAITISYIDLCIAIELAHKLAKDKDDMKPYIYKLLGVSKDISDKSDMFLEKLAGDLELKKMSVI